MINKYCKIINECGIPMISQFNSSQELYDYCDFMWNGKDGKDDSRERGEVFLINQFNQSEHFRKVYAEVLRNNCEEQFIIEMLTGMLWRVAEPRIRSFNKDVFFVLRDLQNNKEVFENYRWPIVKSLGTMFRNSPTPIKFSELRIREWRNKLSFCEGILGVHFREPVRPWVLATVLDLLDEMVQDLDEKRTKTISSTIDVYQTKFSTYEPYETRYPNLAQFAKSYNDSRLRN